MLSIQRLSSATPDSIRHDLRLAIEHLLRRLAQQDLLEELQAIRQMLDSLPLATDDYSTASNRLRNANRYLDSRARGAAGYELRLLAGSLREDERVICPPRRGRRSRVGKPV